MGRMWANREERPKILARGIYHVEEEIVTIVIISRQIKSQLPHLRQIQRGELKFYSEAI